MPRVSLRKLRRWMFATIAIASLILCLATVGLWVRSYWLKDELLQSFGGTAGFRFASSNLGSVRIVRHVSGIDLGPHGASWDYIAEPADSSSVRENNAIDFELNFSQNHINPDRRYLLAFPHWSLALLFAIVPTWRLTAIVRARRRAQPGCCAACGYDLRASPGRCPECGTMAKATA